MRKLVLLLLVPVLLLGLLGCSPAAAGELLKSDKPRDNSPAVAGNDLTALAQNNNAFAFELYQVMRQEEGNLFYSPYSISAALAMTYAGARGGTEVDMAEALNFYLAQERLHAAFNSLDLQFQQRGEGAKGKDDEGFRLNVVNAAWGQRDFKFLDSYLDVLAENYGAGLRLVDFINETEQSRVKINQWVNDQTEERIKDLIPPGTINFLTRLILTNAIYFNAAWEHQFNEDATTSGQFHLRDDGEVTAPMMKQTEQFRYTAGNGYQAVELPYDGNELSMVILLPDDGQFTAFEETLDAEFVAAVIDEMRVYNVYLTMPRFEYETSLGLKEPLSLLGMEVAFTDAADFSGMTQGGGLLIQDVLHKAFVSVDEYGTEAAAATAVVVGLTSAPPESATMTIDRPFIYLIRDIPTGSTLFVGRVMNPAAN